MKPLHMISAGAVLALASGASSALNFNLTYTSGTSANAQAGFVAATSFWSSVFTDPVTVNLTVGLANLGSGILGSTSSTQIDVTYNAFRTALAADATSANDNMAVSSLNAIGSANSFNMLINRTTDNPNGSGSATPYLDNNGSLNNSDIYLTTANAKAAGLLSANNAASDGSVRFATAFEPQFDYDRSNGIAAGQFDFLGIAIHEIGHALGFISGVDLLDFFAGQGTADQFFAVAPLDLFRYSVASTAQNAIDWTASATDKYFSLDNGQTKIASFSTGSNFGDGRQASHWKDNLGLGIMDPTFSLGELGIATNLDRQAFDVIGWNLSAVPETSEYAMLLAGLGLLGFIARRRK